MRLRAERQAAFDGDYEPIHATGPQAHHALAFVRGGLVVTAATRLPAGLQQAGGWGDTSLTLPAGTWTDRLTGATYNDAVACKDLLARLPVALLTRA